MKFTRKRFRSGARRRNAADSVNEAQGFIPADSVIRKTAWEAYKYMLKNLKYTADEKFSLKDGARIASINMRRLFRGVEPVLKADTGLKRFWQLSFNVFDGENSDDKSYIIPDGGGISMGISLKSAKALFNSLVVADGGDSYRVKDKDVIRNYFENVFLHEFEHVVQYVTRRSAFSIILIPFVPMMNYTGLSEVLSRCRYQTLRDEQGAFNANGFIGTILGKGGEGKEEDYGDFSGNDKKAKMSLNGEADTIYDLLGKRLYRLREIIEKKDIADDGKYPFYKNDGGVIATTVLALVFPTVLTLLDDDDKRLVDSVRKQLPRSIQDAKLKLIDPFRRPDGKIFLSRNLTIDKQALVPIRRAFAKNLEKVYNFKDIMPEVVGFPGEKLLTRKFAMMLNKFFSDPARRKRYLEELVEDLKVSTSTAVRKMSGAHQQRLSDPEDMQGVDKNIDSWGRGNSTQEPQYAFFWKSLLKARDRAYTLYNGDRYSLKERVDKFIHGFLYAYKKSQSLSKEFKSDCDITISVTGTDKNGTINNTQPFKYDFSTICSTTPGIFVQNFEFSNLSPERQRDPEIVSEPGGRNTFPDYRFHGIGMDAKAYNVANVYYDEEKAMLGNIGLTLKELVASMLTVFKGESKNIDGSYTKNDKVRIFPYCQFVFFRYRRGNKDLLSGNFTETKSLSDTTNTIRVEGVNVRPTLMSLDEKLRPFSSSSDNPNIRIFDKPLDKEPTREDVVILLIQLLLKLRRYYDIDWLDDLSLRDADEGDVQRKGEFNTLALALALEKMYFGLDWEEKSGPSSDQRHRIYGEFLDDTRLAKGNGFAYNLWNRGEAHASTETLDDKAKDRLGKVSDFYVRYHDSY